VSAASGAYSGTSAVAAQTDTVPPDLSSMALFLL
jgi:hypothetical protein